jgi:hypothetical protein
LSLEYIDAVGQKQFDLVTELLHPDVEFQMSGKTIRGVNEYVSAQRSVGPILVRNDVKNTVVDGNNVCIVYDFVTDTTVGAVPSVEWITVDSGRIRSVRLIFHKENWPTVLAELRRRGSVAV